MSKEAKVGAVTPPKIVRGKRGTQVPKEILDQFAEVLDTTDNEGNPSWVSDNVQYESRSKANAAAMKIRKALANTEGYKYNTESEIQSRVWSGGELNAKNEEQAPFYFALAEKHAEQ